MTSAESSLAELPPRGLWVQGATTSSADPTARLSRWRSVLQRMRDEGLELPR